MDFPGFDNIFSLSEPFATRPFRGSVRDDGPQLDHYALASGELIPSRPVRIVPYGGRVPSDFIWTDAVVIRLVHERIIALFAKHQIKGWSTYPVEVYDENHGPIHGFSGLSITGRSGKIDPSLSTAIQKEMPGGNFPYFQGLLFPADSWDGSDLFSPNGTSHVFVTHTVTELLENANAKNFDATPVAEMEYGEYERTLLERDFKTT